MNRGMYGYPQSVKSPLFHGFPVKRIENELFFGYPSGAEDYDFKCDANVTNFAFSMTLSGTAGAFITIDRGDGGSAIPHTFNGTDQAISWNYGNIGQYNIKFNGDLESITKIVIASNSLIGNLKQSFIDRLINLTTFHCFSNLLSGELPSFNTCTLLTDFQCHSNSFSGTLPSFDACTLLTTFRCDGNSFSGDLPSFNTCTLLTDFRCYSNSFSGTLPSFNACTLLTTFYCYSNLLSGELPSFNACTLLTTFRCYSNSFSGTLPSFNACTLLTEFRCYSNSFSGTLPSFDACTLLTTFYCFSNLLSGELPSFNACTLLTNFRCHSNSFSGTLPSFPYKLTTFNYQFQTNKFSSFTTFISYYFNNRAERSATGDINIGGEGNAVPTGTYQAPSGYVQATTGVDGDDGTPVSDKEMIYVLVNQNINQTTTKKYQFTFTTN